MILNQEAFGTVQIGTALGNGDGTFQALRPQLGSSVLENLRISDDIDVHDVDGDGITDVVVTNYASNDLSIFLANADGSVRPQQRYGVGYGPRFSALGDMDADGRTDLVTNFGLQPIGIQELAVVLRGLGVPPLQLVSAGSRKIHGTTEFVVPLPLTGTPAVECRESNGSHTLVLTFDENVVSGSAQMTAGNGALNGPPTFSGNRLTLQLTGVADQQAITVSVSNVTSASGRVLPSQAVSMRLLAGDSNGNGTVNTSDIGQVKLQAGQPVSIANFRADLIPNGSITSTDVSFVKSRAGNSVGAAGEHLK